MRILSLPSDMQTPSQLRNEVKKAIPTVDKKAEPANAPTHDVTLTSSMVPIVKLDIDAVSHNMAARLCISFLGHVLFLKNQVPFPIVQLARMPTKDHTTRASKKRQELLNSFDTLASHLYTTFIALSTALALRGYPEREEVGTKASPRGQNHGVARVFFAVALGPTVGTARSRVIVGIDGLETKVWGLREDGVPSKPATAPVHAMSEGKEERAGEGTNDTDDEDEESQHDDSGSSSEEGDDHSESDDDEPPSRSPSPTDSDAVPSGSSSNLPSDSPPLRVEDPETVRAAERLLSRTLASACAEDDGQGLASEMAPTQIHVLLRAPRRFNHPSWIPRQNLCTSFDKYLSDFIVGSGEVAASRGTTTKRTKATKMQGIWIKSRGDSTQTDNPEETLAEEDELIWWSWDGKLIGFADW